MSTQFKKTQRIGTKIVAATLFVFLILFNVLIGMHKSESSDLNLFGVKLNIFVPSAIASEYAKEPSELIQTWTVCKNEEIPICKQN